MTESIERIIDIRELTNGKVIKARVLYEDLEGQSLSRDQFLWIRGKTDNRGDRLSKSLVVECHPTLQRMEIPIVDILDGRHKEIEILGVFKARQLGLIDPRDPSIARLMASIAY